MAADAANGPEAQLDPFAHLLPAHKKLILDSAIDPAVAAERGYFSISSKVRLRELGFSTEQCRVPALCIPVHGVTGQIVTYQSRPNLPRISDKGKAIKYETPRNSRMSLDIPPRVRAQLGKVNVALWITEGARKADSAVSKGLACIGVIGVWNWRGTNSDGGKTALADWESIALNGRLVFLAFDSDMLTKPGVREALRRLKEFLELRGADVRIVYIPGIAGGDKVGLDDYFHAGGTVEALIASAKTELPPKPAQSESQLIVRSEYRTLAEGMVRVQHEDDGSETLIGLTNFSAEITATVIEDDGGSTRQYFEITARKGDVQKLVEVPAEEFGAMYWVSKHLDPTFILDAGMSTRDHARAAIQERSDDPPKRTVFTHTGWRDLRVPGAEGADWAYLHAEGAIGAHGAVLGVEVRLPAELQPLRLPPPPDGDSLKTVASTALRLIDLAPDSITFPVFGMVFCAPLTGNDINGHASGTTGTFKTETATLAQQFYGPGFGGALPGSWTSTPNALEGLTYCAKDALFVIDDFAPQGGMGDAARLHRNADRILRAQGNRAGRQRSSADGSLRPTRYPRGLIFSTGEDTPAGQSLRARMCILQFEKNVVNAAELTRCQADARAGVYAATMSGYLRWLAARREGLESRVRQRLQELRALVGEQTEAKHRRTVDVVARLFMALELFSDFARDVGVFDAKQGEAFLGRAWRALLTTGNEQQSEQESFDPVEQFFTLMRSALSSGQAHLANGSGGPPDGLPREALGWHRTTESDSSKEQTWQARGKRIGWVIDDQLYLDPTASYGAAQSMADEVGRIAVTVRTLGRRLSERKLLVTTDAARGKHTTRRTIDGVRHDVLHLMSSVLLGSAPEAQSAQDDERSDRNEGAVPTLAPLSAHAQAQPPANDTCRGPVGPKGPLAELDREALARDAAMHASEIDPDRGTSGSVRGELFDNRQVWEDQ